MASDKIFYYLGTKVEVIQYLINYFASQKIELKEYLPEREIPKDLEYLLIIEPIKIGDRFYTLSPIWKNWLFEHFPSKKLIVASFKTSTHPNLLNLLDLPSDMDKYLKNTHPAGEYIFQPSSKKSGSDQYEYKDTWENYPLPLGINIAQEIGRFLYGHMLSPIVSSYINQLSSLQERMVKIIDIKTKKKTLDDSQYGNHAQELEQILTRWSHYEAIFKFLPFYISVKSIMDNLRNLGEQLGYLTPLEQSSLEKKAAPIDIREKLYTEVHRYVYYEDYW